MERHGDIQFGGPGTYRIVLQGALREDWCRRLGGMAITTSSGQPGEVQTTLQGTVPDQAALHGLLETLYALHLSILEVTRLPSESACEPASMVEGNGSKVAEP